MKQINQLSQALLVCFPNAQIHVSELLPRADTQANNRVRTTNSILREQRAHPNVRLISHNNINQTHLHDEKHLSRRYHEADATRLSGSMLLARNIYIRQSLGNASARWISYLQETDKITALQQDNLTFSSCRSPSLVIN